MKDHPIIPHQEAWPIESRKQMMRTVIQRLSEEGCLRPDFAPAIANTYGIQACLVEAEMLRHMSEGDGK